MFERRGSWLDLWICGRRARYRMCLFVGGLYCWLVSYSTPQSGGLEVAEHKCNQ